MCGITGLINWADGETLSVMTDLLAYRGPDDRGVWERHFPDGTYVDSVTAGSRSSISLRPATCPCRMMQEQSGLPTTARSTTFWNCDAS